MEEQPRQSPITRNTANITGEVFLGIPGIPPGIPGIPGIPPGIPGIPRRIMMFYTIH
jgi:hypothetical protein